MTGVSILIRIISLGAAIALVGSYAFLLLVARPAYHKEAPEEGQVLLPFDHILRRLWVWSLVSFISAGLLGLWVQQASVTNRSFWTVPSAEALGHFLTGTQYGRVWLLRLLLAGLLGGGLLLSVRRWHGQHRQELWWAEAGLASGLLVAQAWTGHAVASEGVTLIWQVTTAALHLLAAGLWLGGLPLLALLLTWTQRADHASAERIAAEATRRFSALGLGSVLLLVVTGVYNTWTLVGTIPALLGTPYGQLLLLKLALLLPLLGLAIVNLRYFKPRLVRVVAAQQRRQTRETLRRLRRCVLCEVVLGAAILLIVGALGNTPPARHVPPTWPFPFRLNWAVTWALPGVWARMLLGGQVALIGLLALGYAILGRYWRGLAAGLGAAGVVAGLYVVCQAMAIEAYPTTYVRPAVPYQALSIANGSHLYQAHCAVCHGVEGYGDGPAASTLNPRPADLTARHTTDHTVGDIFWWLSYGMKGSAMPGFHDRLSEEERWDLINFLRTLAAAEQARPLGPYIDPEPWLVAPDFSYTTMAGDGQTLKDHRGQSHVLLVFFDLPQSHERLVRLRNLAPVLQRLGAQVLAVPLSTHPHIPMEQYSSPHLSLVVDGAAETAEAYGLFRKSPNSTERLPSPPIPSHREFLIDRQGYIRARWLPAHDSVWVDAARLMTMVERLNQEKPRTQAPDEHVH
jgi:putative copper resistance protein D